MKGNLEVKTVNFMGDELVAIRENNSGKIYVGVKWICDGLGLKLETQRKKITEHEVLREGLLLRGVPTNSGKQETNVLDIEYLPMWLVTISPGRVNQNTKEKLVEYQRRAKDVLANAFVPQYVQQANKDIITQIPKDFQTALRLLADKIDENEKLKPKARKYDTFLTAKNAQSMNHVAKCLHTGRNKLFKFLREQEVLMDDNVPYQRYVNSGHFITKEITVWNGEESFNTVQTLVTAKGVGFIADLLSKQLRTAN